MDGSWHLYVNGDSLLKSDWLTDTLAWRWSIAGKTAMLNYEQSQALEFIKSGHSCVVLGQAGTGKSYLIKETLKKLNNKNVSVTASTGLAAWQFTGATTIHHWAGLMDGRFENQHLLRIISEETRNRIKTCNVLIIDEISMISRKVFEQVRVIFL